MILKEKKTLDKIEKALDEVRPFLEADGGGVELVEITDDFIVKVKLTGACSDCSISMQTLKNGIEVGIKKALPFVVEVVDVS